MLWGNKGRRKLCKVPCHSCHIRRTWRSKEVGWDSKVIILRGVGGGEARKRETVSMGAVDLSIIHEGCSHYVTLLFWNSIVILGRYCKSLFWIPLFNTLLVFYIYWDKKKLVASKCIYHLNVSNVSFFWENPSNWI